MANVQFLRAKPLSKKTTRASSADLVLLNCAKHNLREIHCESHDTESGSIDPERRHLNVTLRGCDTAAGVVEMAENLLRVDGIKIEERANATLGAELVFSLPATTLIDCVAYFSAAIEWAERYFQSPAITAICHFDQDQPHCHVIFQPVCNGAWRGSYFLGGRPEVKAMHKAFHEAVGKQYGLRQGTPRKRHSAADKRTAAAHALDILKANLERLNEPAVEQALIDLIAADLEQLLAALGHPMPESKQKSTKTKIKTFVDIMIKPQKPEKANGKFAGKILLGDLSDEKAAVLATEKTISYPVLGDFKPAQSATVIDGHQFDASAADYSDPAALSIPPPTVLQSSLPSDAIEPSIDTAAMPSPAMPDASDSVPTACAVDLHIDAPDAPSQLDSSLMPALVVSPSAMPTSADAQPPIDANTSLDLVAPNASDPAAGDPGPQSDDDGDSRRVERDDDIIAVDWDTGQSIRQTAKPASSKLQAAALVRAVISKPMDSAEPDARLRWASA